MRQREQNRVKAAEIKKQGDVGPAKGVFGNRVPEET